MGTYIETYRILLLGTVIFLLMTFSIFSLHVGINNDQNETDRLYNCLMLKGPCPGEAVTLVAQVQSLDDGAVVVHFQRFPQVEHLLDLLGVLVRLAFTSIRPQIRKLHMKKPADLLQGLFRPLIGFLEAGLQPARPYRRGAR